MIKGAMHVHSTYSDGDFKLDELRAIFLDQGCHFVCVTDHAEYFDQSSIRDYLDDLQRCSDQEFCFVMGLEYGCDRNMHILGYGASATSDTKDPQAVIRHIRSQGAIPVIAHPKDEFFPWIQQFETLPDGIEVWNSKYDGRYAPRPGTFALLQSLRTRVPEMRAFYGQDLHWRNQSRGLCVNVRCDVLDPAALLAAIAAGSYSAEREGLVLPSSGIVPVQLLEQFGRVHARSHRMWRFLKSSKQQLDRLGIRVPDSLKDQLRRIF